jgi:hypothetical protein
MATETAHIYRNEVIVEGSADMVYKALSMPPTFMGPDVRCLDVLSSSSGTVRPGDFWRESRASLLFLRDWAAVSCVSAQPGKTLQLSMDDGHSRILLTYCVTPVGNTQESSSISSSSTCVTETVECYACHAPGQAVPSERLACMFRKADKKLEALKLHLQQQQQQQQRDWVNRDQQELGGSSPTDSMNSSTSEFSFSPCPGSPDGLALTSSWFSSDLSGG